MNPSEKILLVEGESDKHVIRHLQGRILPTVEFEINAKGSVEEVLKSIGPEVKVSGRVAVGIVVDANNSSSDRWRAISDRLARVDIAAASASPPHRGALIDGVPRVGVWLMPDNRSTGMLEDFVKKMVPSDDPVWALAKEYIQGIPTNLRKFTPGRTSSAELHAWLATRKTPGPMGRAIRIGDLKTDGELCVAFLKWIEKLFE